MAEKPFGAENGAPNMEVVPTETKRLGEGVSKGWENERRFTAEEVRAAIEALGIAAEDLKATWQLVSHEGVLLSLRMRAPGGAIEYSYTLKGDHGPRVGSAVTYIERVEFSGPDSEDVERAEIIAEYKDGVWAKS